MRETDMKGAGTKEVGIQRADKGLDTTALGMREADRKELDMKELGTRELDRSELGMKALGRPAGTKLYKKVGMMTALDMAEPVCLGVVLLLKS